MKGKKGYISFEGAYLGGIQFAPSKFSKDIYDEIDSEAFKKLATYQKHNRVNTLLFDAIQKEEDEVFLLPHVVDYITHIRTILPTYHLASFEFWLNQHLEISDEIKMRIRAKIVGKWIHRNEYQNFFPINTGAYFPGSHYSYGHISPDLDTTVASFASFLAAFGAKVGEGRHHWVLPGGPPKESIEIEFFFKKALGEEFFSAIGSASTKFLISALDLVSQKNIIRKLSSTLTYDIDPERGRQAVIHVDERGCYLGDWRSVDVDPVRSIVDKFRNFLTEYQNKFVVGIITLFSNDSLDSKNWTGFLNQKFLNKFSESLSARELNEKQQRLLDKFIKEVLFIPNGLNATIGEFFEVAKSFGFEELKEKLESVKKSGLFDRRGELTENRALIFKKLEEILSLEKEAFHRFFQYIDSLEAAMEIKRKVLEREPSYLSHLAEFDEIVQVIKDYGHLTVNYQENGTLYPLGVIYADDIKRKVIATTSWNDFSNPGETDLREGVEVISYIDHHKSNITTARPAFGMVRADAQSSNSMIARINFDINDRYSTGGMTKEEIEERIKKISKHINSPTNIRILERLLQKKRAHESKGDFYVAKEREILEYIQFIFAILDDTDLLTKVSEYDLDVMASLLNRLKSLMLGDEVEIVNFDDILRNDPEFTKKAAKKLLQTHDLYSLYGVIYKAKEEAIDHLIQMTASGKETHFFQDTKLLGSGGYAAVGQFKHFARNEPLLRKNITKIRKAWIERSERTFKKGPEILLHMFMVSTVSSAEELFSDSLQKPTYSDEIWFWVPEDDKKAEHYLTNFFLEFAKTPRAVKQELCFEFCGKANRYEKIFAEAFAGKMFKSEHSKSEPTMIVLKVAAGSIKSRKTDVAICL